MTPLAHNAIAGGWQAAPADRRGGTGRGPLWAAATTVILVGLLITLSLTPLNPDWLAYFLIYDDEGAWLSEQGRDPLFLLYVKAAQRLLGPDSYEDFRTLSGALLLGFTVLLATGRVLRPRAGLVPSLALVIVVLAFASARFTIQIREGLAAALLVWAIAAMIGVSARAKVGPAAWMLLLAAALVHGGTAIYLVVALVAVLWPGLRGPQGTAQGAWASLWLLALAFAVVVPLSLSSPDDAAFLARSFGDRVDEFTELNAERVLLQVAYLVAAGFVCRETMRATASLPLASPARAFLRVLGGPLLFCLIGLTLGAVLVSAPNALIASFSRFVYLCMGLCLLVATFGGGRRAPLIGVCLFMVADQIRVIVVSATALIEAAGL
jgi:hypothetical protein